MVKNNGPKFICNCPSCGEKINISPIQLFSSVNWPSETNFTTDNGVSWLPHMVASCAVCGGDIKVVLNLELSVEKKRYPELRLVVNNG